MPAIELGATYTDRITRFSGVCTGYVTYITGCNQALLAPPAKDGALVDSQWFDEQRLELHSDIDVIALDNRTSPGSDRAAPKR
jgi:hypothetical protein